MPTNLEATKARARWVWRFRGMVWVSFPTLPRAFEALSRLADRGEECDYDGHQDGRHWVKITPLRSWLNPA